MAGLKNMYQMQGLMPTNSVSGDTIFERHAAFQAQEYTPYCRYCGQEIIDATQDEEGSAVDYQMELYYQAHTHCLNSRF